MNKRSWSKEEFIKAVTESFSYAEALRKLDLHPSGCNYTMIKRFIKEYDIDISHMTGQLWSKGKKLEDSKYHKTYDFDEVFIDNSKYKGNNNAIKQRLIREGYKKEVCENCHQTEWLGEKIPLELHHSNGKKDDLRIENLVLLCPNCHSLTENYGGKNKKKKKVFTNVAESNLKNKEKTKYVCPVCKREFIPSRQKQKYCSVECAKKSQIKCNIDLSIINDEHNNGLSYVDLSKKYNVSDKTIKNWLEKYNKQN